jgi:hypothetical protein
MATPKPLLGSFIFTQLKALGVLHAVIRPYDRSRVVVCSRLGAEQARKLVLLVRIRALSSLSALLCKIVKLGDNFL